MASEKDTKKSMDISRPGKTPPDESSRPVVVSHRPMVQDPMMVSSDEKTSDLETPSPKPIEPPSHSSKVLLPLSEQTSEEDKKKPAESSKEKTEPEAKETKPAQSSQAAVVDAVVDQVDVGRKKNSGPTEAEKAKQEALQKLIAEKKYFVPIGHGHKKSSPVSLILLVLLIAAAGFYLAVDAGVVGQNIKLPVDIIKT